MTVKQNPDKAHAQEVRKKLKENNGYCPCVVIQNDETKCMCKSFREQDYEGECHCGLYIKVEE